MDSEFHDFFGYVGPTVRARRVVSIGHQGPEEDAELAEMIAGLDELLREVNATESSEGDAEVPARPASAGDPARADDAEPPVRDDGESSTPAGTQRAGAAPSAPSASSQLGSTPLIPADATAGVILEPEARANCPVPYFHLMAGHAIRKLTKLMRGISSESRWLVPEPSSWNPLGTGSCFSSRSINTVKEEDIKYIGMLRSRFPSSFTLEPTGSSSVRVSPGEPKGLPRWKDKGKPGKAARNVNEILLGIRVASLVADGKPTLAHLGQMVDSPDLGFFSMRLPSHLAETFSDAGRGSDVLARTLMRRLKNHHPSAMGVFAWRRDVEGDVTLFGALSKAAYGNAGTYAAFRSGLRFGRSLARAGVTEAKFYNIEPETFAELYDLPSESFVIKGWADRNAEDFVGMHTDAVDPIEFDFVAKRFRTAQEVDALNARSEAIWTDYVTRCGLPAWFGTDFLDIFLEALVRTPEAAREHRHAEEIKDKYMEKRSKKEQAKAVMARVEEVDAITLDTLRFYRGSPAEFAALATSEGQLIGIYCPAELMKMGEELYSDLRSGKL